MSVTKSIQSLGRPVAYYPSIARWLDGDIGAAVFLCQFIYWRGRVGDRKIYKSRPEIEAETGLSERVQKRICSKLKRRGYVEIIKKGMPARNFYDFDWDRIDADFSDWTGQNVPTSEYQTSRLEGTDGTDKMVPNVPTTSETTTETTTESTQSGSATATHPTLHVPINQTRYDNLCAKYGATTVDDYIQRVIDWGAATGKRTKDYAARASTWIRRDEQEGKLYSTRASPTPQDEVQDFSHLRSDYGC